MKKFKILLGTYLCIVFCFAVCLGILHLNIQINVENTDCSPDLNFIRVLINAIFRGSQGEEVNQDSEANPEKTL